MSAFIVSRQHIQQLVESINVHIEPLTDPTAVGQQLWDENIASVHTRYPDEPLEDLPGPRGENFTYHHQVPECLMGTLSLLKLARSYAYQSCEHEGWAGSRARTLIERLQTAMYARYCNTILKRPIPLESLLRSEAYAVAT